MNRKRKSAQLAQAELVELARYARLGAGKFELSDEFSAAVYSTWYLLDPMRTGGRASVGSNAPLCGPLTREQRKNAIGFTAHSHTEEPKEPSPDDLLIYSEIAACGGDQVNFITDRFVCKKIL